MANNNREDLNKVKEIFLSPELDEETRQENAERIQQWEETISKHSSFVDWQNIDITQQLRRQMLDMYKEDALLLATKRDLTDRQRDLLFARQDAVKFVLSFIEKDAKSTLEGVYTEIKQAISAG